MNCDRRRRSLAMTRRSRKVGRLTFARRQVYYTSNYFARVLAHQAPWPGDTRIARILFLYCALGAKQEPSGLIWQLGTGKSQVSLFFFYLPNSGGWKCVFVGARTLVCEHQGRGTQSANATRAWNTLVGRLDDALRPENTSSVPTAFPCRTLTGPSSVLYRH